MSLYINKFIDSVRAAETRGQRELVMPINDAKNLHAEITKLLLGMETLRENLAKNNNQNNDYVEIQVNGGSF